MTTRRRCWCRVVRRGKKAQKTSTTSLGLRWRGARYFFTFISSLILLTHKQYFLLGTISLTSTMNNTQHPTTTTSYSGTVTTYPPSIPHDDNKYDTTRMTMSTTQQRRVQHDYVYVPMMTTYDDDDKWQVRPTMTTTSTNDHEYDTTTTSMTRWRRRCRVDERVRRGKEAQKTSTTSLGLQCFFFSVLVLLTHFF
jgi:hypothetical protein